ncbi:MAG: PilZ domain-containing protein [Acidobacteriota bacterium]
MARKEDRYSYLQEVELEFASGKRSARISDISSGGCYIDTIAQIPVGEPLNLRILAINGESMQFRGTVAYILEGVGFGVEFTDITVDHRKFILRLLSSSER